MGHIFAVSIRYTLMGQKDGGRLPLPLFFAMEGEMLMKIGYIRVSTVEQNTIRQETLMEALGVDEIYMDKVSGKNTNCPELQKMLHYVRKGGYRYCRIDQPLRKEYERPFGVGRTAYCKRG